MRLSKFIGPIEIYQTESIGSGSTGNVFKGKLRNYSINMNSLSQIQLAVKVIPHLQRYQNEVTKYLFQSQKQALTKLNHPHIVKCYGVFQDNKNSYLATQFIKGWSLKQYMIQKGKLKQKDAIHLFKKLLQATLYLNLNGIIHRDLKPANIMIKQIIDQKTQQTNLYPYIIDFGFAERVNFNWKPQMFYNVGSPSYMAPQSYNFTKYSQKSDLWAIGVIFYQTLAGEAFDSNIIIEQFFNNTEQIVKKKLSQKRGIFSIRTMKILKSILIPDQQKRLSIKQVILLIERLQTQLESLSLIKKKKLSPERNIPKVFGKIKQQQNKRNMLFQVKPLKSQQFRQRGRIPSFLDKTKKSERQKTLEKTVEKNNEQKSPRLRIVFSSYQEKVSLNQIKSQQSIKHTPLLNNNQTIINYPIKKTIQIERSPISRRNTHVVSMNATSNPFLSPRVINYNNFSNHNPQVKVFDRLAFEYKSGPSNSFHQYLSPASHQYSRKTPFFVVS